MTNFHAVGGGFILELFWDIEKPLVIRTETYPLINPQISGLTHFSLRGERLKSFSLPDVLAI